MAQHKQAASGTDTFEFSSEAADALLSMEAAAEQFQTQCEGKQDAGNILERARPLVDAIVKEDNATLVQWLKAVAGSLSMHVHKTFSDLEASMQRVKRLGESGMPRLRHW